MKYTKRILQTIACALLLWAAMLGLIISTAGCAGAPRVAYTAAQTATITVEGAMGLWDAYVAEKHPGVAAELKVKAAYERYQAADIALLKAGKAMLEVQQTATDAEKASLKLAWQQAEAALTASASDVYALLKSFGIKLP